MHANTNSSVAPHIAAARDFTRHLSDLLRKEQGAMVNFLLALSECDGRKLWADLGYASLFEYLHRELGMSKGAAFYRKTAAMLVQRYPEIVDALADGRLCITSLAEVAKVITPENAAEVLPRFFHRSSREAKEVAAAIAPDTAPPRREVISMVKVEKAPGTASSPTVQALEHLGRRPSAGEVATEKTVPSFLARPERREEVKPLTANLRRIHFTVTKQWMEKLDAAKAALSHSIPGGSAEQILDAALDALLEREAKRKGLVKNPRKPRPATETPPVGGAAPAANDANSSKSHRKAVPAHVRREVLRRDGEQCQAKLHDGTICGSKVRLQFDHVLPDALGGPATIENGRVLCASHNQLAARRVFGDQIMDLFGRRKR